MSRNARHDIDLSALPTVADLEDDDLIDRDEKWQAYQQGKVQVPAHEPEPEAVAHEPEPEPVYEQHVEEVQAEVASVAEEPAEAAHKPDEVWGEENVVETHAPSREKAAVEPENAPVPIVARADAKPEPPAESKPKSIIETPRVVVEEKHEPAPARPAPVKERLRDKKRSKDTPLVSLGSQAANAESAQKESSPSEEGEKHFEVPKPPPDEPVTEEEKKRRYWERIKEKVGLSSLGLSVAIHVALLILATLIGISQAIDKQVDFLPGGSPAGKSASEALEHKVQQKRNPWLKSKPQLRRVTVQSIASEVQLPEMDLDSLDLSNLNKGMQLGKLGSIGPSGGGMGTGGAGGGFGAGIGKGGMFSFLGQTAFGRRVVFVCDVSASMSTTGEGGVTRFQVLKKELVKSLQKLPAGTNYQILFFSDFAWPHNTVDPKKGAAFEKYRWEITPDKYKSAKIPTYAYLLVNGFNISDSRKIVEEADNPGGTNWGSGLLMALKGNPKPDVIFFMTDGQASDEQGWVDIVTNENKRTRPVSVIHTSVMMETGASEHMSRLAKANGGTFSIVLRDGTVVKGN